MNDLEIQLYDLHLYRKICLINLLVQKFFFKDNCQKGAASLLSFSFYIYFDVLFEAAERKINILVSIVVNRIFINYSANFILLKR
jgi:hypothetical protein